MGIKVTVRQLDFPEWIDKAYEEISPEEIEDIIKAIMYSQIKPVENGEFEISELLQKGANRVPVLENIGHCLWALNTTMTFMAWNIMDERGEVKIREIEIDQDKLKITRTPIGAEKTERPKDVKDV